MFSFESWDGNYEFSVYHNNHWAKADNPVDELFLDVEFPMEEEIIEEEPIPEVPDIYAEFPGGEKRLDKWIQENIKYPEEANKKNLEGVVQVGFTIEKDGRIIDVMIIKGIDPILDREALMIKNMPKWGPAEVSGRKRQANGNISIEFKKGNRPSLLNYETLIPILD